MTIKEIAERVLTESNKEMHVDKIAEQAISLKLVSETDKNKLSIRISSALANDIAKRKGNSSFRKVTNKKGGHRKGFYRLKRQFKTPTEKIIRSIPTNNDYLKPDVSTLYVGKGGECSVMSELLFNGFNSNMMVVDEGIDIVASKFEKFFYIQVKTTYIQKDKLVVPSIKFRRFNQFEKQNTYYIIVLRYYTEKTPRNAFLIFKSSDIEKYLATGKIKNESDRINISLKLSEGKIYIFNGKNTEDVQYHFNNFDMIK